MAYVVNTTNTAITTSAGSTYTITLGAHQDGDLLLVCVTQASGNVDFSATGWTAVGTQNRYPAGYGRQGWLYKVVGTGEAPVANPAVACRVGEAIIGMSITVRKASLTPTIRWQRTDWGDFSTTYSATTNPPTASIETANAAVVAPENALLIYSVGSQSNPSYRASANDLMELAYQTSVSSAYCAQSVGYRQINAGATVPSITWKSTIVAGGNAWVLSIPDDGDGVIDRNWFSGGTEFDYYGDYGEAHFPFGTEGVPNTLDNAQASPPATPSIDGVDLGGGTPSVSHTSLVLATNSPNGKCTSIRTDDITASLWTGVVQTLNSNQNMSGKIFSVHYRLDRDSNAVFGDKGCCVAFADSAGDWIAYQLATNPAILSNPERTAFIELGGGDQLDADGGAVDWTDIDKIGWFIHRDGSGNNNTDLYIKNAQLLSTAVYTGGASARPLTIASAKPLTESWDFYKLQGLQASAQSEIRWPIQIGDGTFKTYFKASAASTETPTAHDVTTSTSQQDWNVSDDACGVTVYASANCTMDFSAALLTSATKQPFTIHASSSTSATYSFQGLTLVGWTVTWKTGIPATLTGVTFDSCYEIDMKGQDMTSCTVDNTANSAAGKAALTFTENGAVLDGCTIDGTGAAYALELGTAVTAITLADCTLTAGSTDKVHVLKTTGTVTITISGMTVLDVGSVTSEGATVQVDAPVVTADISITGMPIAGTDIWLQIINTTALSAASRANSTAYSAGDIRLRQTGIGTEQTAGLYLRCTTSGTSAGTPPTWNTTVGGTTTDGTVVWTTYAVLYFHADPASATLTDTYIDGEEFLAGETVDIRFAEMNAGTSFKRYSTTVLAETTGFSALVTEEADDVYATNALDGSAYETTFSPDFTNDYIVLDTNTDFAGKAAYAYFCYTLTTDAGMWNFWGGVTALDVGNYRINTAILDLYFDESAGFVKQTDDVRIFRDNGTRPAIDPTTGGHGIEINWRTPVSVVSTGGSAVLPQDIVDIAAASAAAVVADGKTLTVPKFLGLK